MPKLHIGCGQNYLDGYINLEFEKMFSQKPFRVDLLGDGVQLPFRPGAFTEVASYHVIEHLPRPKPDRSQNGASPRRKNSQDFLDECYRVLDTGGKIVIECPDFERLLREIVFNDQWQMLDNIFGLDRYRGDTHQWGYTRTGLSKLLKEHGFQAISVSEGTDYHKDDEPCMRVEGYKLGLRYINIEPTSACNLKCKICTRDPKKRNTGPMDLALFRKIIDQLAALQLFDVELRFFLSGEPLLAGETLIEMLRIAKESCFENTLIHTNGTLLDRWGDQILEAGIGKVSISIDGAEKETYESVRVGVNFERVIAYARNFVQKAKTFSTKTVVQTIISSGQDIELYQEKMSVLVPGADEYYVRHPHHWNQQDGIPGAIHHPHPVTRCFPDMMLSIYSDGRVPLCCADLNGDCIVGDANTDSLLDLWVNRLGSFRQRMRRQESIPEACDHCDRYQWKELEQKKTNQAPGTPAKPGRNEKPVSPANKDVEKETALVLPLPPNYQDTIGAGDFISVGKEFLEYFTRFGGLRPGDSVLDVGCGFGRMAFPLTNYLGPQGRYYGIDMAPDEIRWCRENITANYPNFIFHHADVYNKQYNPSGKINARAYRFPFPNAMFHFVILTSVFTHMLPNDLWNYLCEIYRVLKPGGRGLISFFVYRKPLLPETVSGFPFDVGEFRIRDQGDPEAAVAYEESFVAKLFSSTGFLIEEPIRFGTWNGDPAGLSYQDILIFRK